MTDPAFVAPPLAQAPQQVPQPQPLPPLIPAQPSTPWQPPPAAAPTPMPASSVIQQVRARVADEDLWGRFVEIWNNQVQAAALRGKEQGIDENSWTVLFRGMTKSMTTYAAVILLAWPTYEAQLTPLLQRLFGVERYSSVVIPIVGLIFLILRIKTTQSLESKGANPHAKITS